MRRWLRDVLSVLLDRWTNLWEITPASPSLTGTGCKPWSATLAPRPAVPIEPARLAHLHVGLPEDLPRAPAQAAVPEDAEGDGGIASAAAYAEQQQRVRASHRKAVLQGEGGRQLLCFWPSRRLHLARPCRQRFCSSNRSRAGSRTSTR